MIEYNTDIYSQLLILAIFSILSLAYIVINRVKKHDKFFLFIPAAVFVLVIGLFVGDVLDKTYYTKEIQTLYPDDFTYLDDGYEIVIVYDDAYDTRISITDEQNYKHVSEGNFIIKRYKDYNCLDNTITTYDAVITIMNKEYKADKQVKINL